MGREGGTFCLAWGIAVLALVLASAVSAAFAVLFLPAGVVLAAAPAVDPQTLYNQSWAPTFRVARPLVLLLAAGWVLIGALAVVALFA